MHCQWRGCQEWRDLGMPLSTTSNEASKMFDATISQYIGFYENESEGGLVTTMTKMLQADPEFAMGHILKNGMTLTGGVRSLLTDESLVEELNQAIRLAESSPIQQERDHAKALKLWAEGQTLKACEVWEGILLDNPYDVAALKFAYHTYFILGESYRVRDIVGRTLPAWKPDTPLYGYAAA